MDLSWLIWLFVLAQFFVPLYQKQMLALRRNRAFYGFEQRRKTTTPSTSPACAISASR
ncbi:MAG: hypothetical protein M3O99_03180 [Chloroflexota bacterium]|nr:hypothetical protein [Chloroflexota bacterium]